MYPCIFAHEKSWPRGPLKFCGNGSSATAVKTPPWLCARACTRVCLCCSWRLWSSWCSERYVSPPHHIRHLTVTSLSISAASLRSSHRLCNIELRCNSSLDLSCYFTTLIVYIRRTAIYSFVYCKQCNAFPGAPNCRFSCLYCYLISRFVMKTICRCAYCMQETELRVIAVAGRNLANEESTLPAFKMPPFSKSSKCEFLG